MLTMSCLWKGVRKALVMMKRWKSVIGGCEQASNGSTSKSDVLTLHLEKVLIKALSADLPSATSLFTVGI